VTWADIKTRFWEIYGGDETLYPELSDQLLALANMTVRRFVAETDSLVGRASIVCEAGTQNYDMPTNCDKIIRAAYDGDKLTAVSKWSLHCGVYGNGWDRLQGTPRHYFLDGLNEQIGLYRIPSVDTTLEETDNSETIGSGYGAVIAPSGTGARISNTGYGAVVVDFGGSTYDISANALDLFFYARPNDLEYDSDVPDLPAWMHTYVLYDILRAVYTMKFPSQDYERAAFFGRLVQSGLKKLRSVATKPTPKSYVFREQDGLETVGTWPFQYPEHIEESS
jgi:hypothetical protein